MNHGEYSIRRLFANVLVASAFIPPEEIFTFTCINAEIDAFEWMDFGVALCALKVIYHAPYPACQIC